MASRKLLEKDLYEAVRHWASKHFGCFETGVNKGTEHGRVDVVGLRQVSGDHAAETDIICIEVKRGNQPFLNALGQAVGYSVYGNFCYLADYRPDTSFSEVEREIAEQLGIGLLRIRRNQQVDLVSTARRCHPSENFRLRIADQLNYVKCTVCTTFFPRSKENKSLYDWSLLEKDKDNRAKIRKAIEDGRGLVYWPEHASAQDTTHNKRHRDEKIYNRRFLCKTCANLFFTE